MVESTKVIIIGAGWSGLVAARTYLHISKLLDRPIDLTIIDESNGPGGVWSTSRLYPGLIANSPVGLYEYSHMTMVSDEQPLYQILPGTGVQSYLEAYARKFNIYSKIRFHTKVTKARRRAGASSGWIIETNKGEVLECDKLVVSTGLYSKPRIPSVPSSTYTGFSVHHHDLGARNEALRSDPSITNVVVVGGCKSSIEACNLFLPTLNPKKRHRVSWVVRPSEQGVPIIVQDVNKANNIIAVNQTRAFAAISPSIYNTTSFGYKFFHSGKYILGTLIISLIWRLMTYRLRRDVKFDSSKNGRKIKPHGNSVFYDLNTISLLPEGHPFLTHLHADDDDVLRVHRATPVKLQDKQMILMAADGSTTTIPCDAVIWCTGWLPAMDFFSEADKAQLGLPVLLPTEPTRNTTSHPSPPDSEFLANTKPPSAYVSNPTSLAVSAEQRILSLFPALLAPARPGYPPPYTPYRLYRQCLPLSSIPPTLSPSSSWDRSLIFSGLISNAQTAICTELTSLWAVAYLENLLPHSSLPRSREQAEETVELALAFARRRYGVKGGRDPEIVLEVQSFLDVLMGDLGVEMWRKRKALDLPGSAQRKGWDAIDGEDRSERENERGGGAGAGAGEEKIRIEKVGKKVSWWENLRGWITEYTTPYFAKDYETTIQEFLENNGYMKKTGASEEIFNE